MARKNQTENADGVTAEPARPARKPRTPNEYMLETASGAASERTWLPLKDVPGFPSTDEAIRHVEANELIGTFRVVLVKRVVTAAEETIKKIKLT